MTRRGFRSTAREVFLTSGAVLGVLCILATVAGVAFGLVPLVFRSGSMSPAIQTGDLAISRTVPASEVERGDVVSVIASTGSRVTHRVVNVAENGEQRQLTLKGDDNADPDAEVYTVTSVERVWFSIPKAGYVVDAATSPAGIFVLGLYVAGMLVLVFRRRPAAGDSGPDDAAPSGGRRKGARSAPRASRSTGTRRARRVSVVVVVTATVALLGTSPGWAAAWTDSVPFNVTGAPATWTALTVPAPTNGACSSQAAGAVISWTSAGTGYSYRVTVTNASTGAEVTSTTTTGTSATMSTALLGNLASTNLVATARAYPTAATTWLSTGSVAQNFRARTLGLGTVCGHL
ncbi:signal peptidase I [Aeromicrobium alkaliterrae]|uniref:Signal peptidase I n=1 Tax=Aeromicrobium alkaliterrae TaxID=302168 RepID=A0ABN2JIQ3_9ACTN